MNDPRDTGSAGPGSAGAPSRTPDAGQPRKPRIEVLQRTPAAAPGGTEGGNSSGIGAAGTAAQGAPPAQASWVAPDAPHRTDSAPERRRRGRSPTTLLMLLAAAVIAGFLLYTYLSSQRGADYPDKGAQVSPADAELLGDPDAASDAATAEEPGNAPVPASTGDEAAPEGEPTAPSAPDNEPERAAPRAAAPQARLEATADRAEEPVAAKPAPQADAGGASNTVRAFYSALGAGDGSSAAQLVVPAKRRSGPLSAGALSRYYSSFRRPLRLRSVTPVDADTVRVAYDYVLADGRECRGQAAVDVEQRGGRSLVSSIRTRGPC